MRAKKHDINEHIEAITNAVSGTKWIGKKEILEQILAEFADEMAKVNWDTKSDGVLFKIIAKHLSESTDNVVEYNRKCDKYLLNKK